MEALKQERSNIKRRVSILYNRLTKAVEKELGPATVSSKYDDLEDAYLDFLGVDEEYSLAIQEDESLKEEFEVVNGLDLAQYAESVEHIWQQAKVIYNHFQSHQVEKEVVTEESLVGIDITEPGEMPHDNLNLHPDNVSNATSSIPSLTPNITVSSGLQSPIYTSSANPQFPTASQLQSSASSVYSIMPTSSPQFPTASQLQSPVSSVYSIMPTPSPQSLSANQPSLLYPGQSIPHAARQHQSPAEALFDNVGVCPSVMTSNHCQPNYFTTSSYPFSNGAVTSAAPMYNPAGYQPPAHSLFHSTQSTVVSNVYSGMSPLAATFNPNTNSSYNMPQPSHRPPDVRIKHV